jgi:hypothetical protein
MLPLQTVNEGEVVSARAREYSPSRVRISVKSDTLTAKPIPGLE